MINRLLALPSSSLRLARFDSLARVWNLRQDIRAICDVFQRTLKIEHVLASPACQFQVDHRMRGSLLFGSTQSQRDSFDPFGGPSSKSGAQSPKTSSNERKQEDENEEEERKKKFQKQALFISTILGLVYAITSVSYYKQVKQLEEQIARERESRGNAPAAVSAPGGVAAPSQQYSTNEIDQLLSQNDPRQGAAPVAQPAAEPAFSLNTKDGNMLTWHELRMLVARKRVLEVRIARKSDVAIVVVKPDVEMSGGARPKYPFYFVQANYEEIERRLTKLQDELNIKPEERVPIVFKDADSINSLISVILTAGLLVLFYRVGRFLFSKAQTMQQDRFSQFTKARYTTVDPHLKSGVPQVNFKDVAGLHEAKIEVKEFVDYLREPERFTKLGAKVPRGALLLGPPGCGKTLLAKAVANEANVPFFNIAGTEFIEVIGGVGAARVRDLFEQARKQSPAIIYIDEIDAIGRKRSDGGMSSTGGSGESDQTLNQLLVSMDGLESSSNVVVLASTNRADILDKALLRPGRLDRHITIDLPTYEERIEILNVHMARLKLNFEGDDRTQFVSQLSHLTPRFSGADLANICNESALLAARDGHTSIDKKDFYHALERVLAGAEKKNTTISVEDRRLIAFHECGKVIMSWFTPNSDLILKVSLLSRTKVNSFAQYLPSDKKLFSQEDLFDQMCLQMGGRVSEGLVFDRYTTNSERDLKKVTQLAYTQIESLGMNDVVGNVSFPTRAEEKSRGMVGEKPYSRKLRNVIDNEVAKLTAEAHKRTEKIIRENLDKLHKLAEELLKRESLTFEEIVALIGDPVNKQRYRNIQMNKPHVQ